MKEKLTEDVKNVLAKKGLSESEINDFLKKADRPGRESSVLPSEGTFFFDPEQHIAGDGQFRHLRIGVVDSIDTCSISRIKAVGLIGDGQPTFTVVTRNDSPLKGSKVLRGQSINPRFSGLSPIELIDFLNGKKFQAEAVNIKVLPYKEGGWNNPTADDLAVQTTYRITLV